MLSLNKKCLEDIFSRLSNEDLVSCTLVNSSWKEIVLKIITTRATKQIRLYDTFTTIQTFDRSRVVHLDLTELFKPNRTSHVVLNYSIFWSNLTAFVQYFHHLEVIELQYCPIYVIESLSITNPALQKIKLMNSRGPIVNLVCLRRFTRLKELYLQFVYVTWIQVFLDYKLNNELTNLLDLTLTGVSNLHVYSIVRVINFGSLQSLSLGCCSQLSHDFTSMLTNLSELKKLRLEECRDTTVAAVFQAVARMQNLKHLEMIDMDIPDGTDDAIERCTNLTKLLIAPNYNNLTDSIDNYIILCGVLQLRNLKHFQWIFASKSFSESWNEISILKELPYLNEYGDIELPLAIEDEVQMFDRKDQVVSVGHYQVKQLLERPSIWVLDTRLLYDSFEKLF
ncbi:hypothetical protein ILUMI_02516 [Ignelater luminosus]|uniref:F-box domain-containing protein n=1 Tax=Ignelater luminosus TaxID=2038154 RepID=A0A8K0GJ71_IGNLU|nr:hypothetical protein ILUMI_02516 [Ignelater luminosus]